MAKTPNKPAKAKKGKQYIDEHRLAVLMSLFKQYQSETPVDGEIRDLYESTRREYLQALEDGYDKRNVKVNQPFMKMLELSTKLAPNNREIRELHEMITLIADRCIMTFSRDRSLDVDDVANATFERWMKYRHAFDPLKRSEISGTRVNAFSYMTQMVKNMIYELFHKSQQDQRIVREISGPRTAGIGKLRTSNDLEEDNDGINELEMVGVDHSFAEDLDESDLLKSIEIALRDCNNIKELMFQVVEDGYTKEEVINAIIDYGILDHIETKTKYNQWEF